MLSVVMRCLVVFLLAAVMDMAQQDKVAEIFQAARAAERSRELDKALALYDELLRISDIAEIWTNKGLVLLELGRDAEALAAFERSTAKNPKLVTPLRFAGVASMRLGRPRAAVAPLEKALALDPANTQIARELARACLASDSYERAVSLLKKVAADPAADDDAFFTLGLAYLEWSKSLGSRLAGGNSPYGLIVQADAEAVANFPIPAARRYREAIAQLTAVERAELPVDPATFRVTAERGVPTGRAGKAWKAGRYEEVLAITREQLRRTPNARALFWQFLATRALARESLLAAVERNPNSARAHLVAAQIAKDDNDSQRAASELEKAAIADPGNATVRLMFIQHLTDTRSADVLAKAREAVAAFPNHAELNVELGKALLKTGDAAAALQAFGTAAAADPSLAAAHAGVADAHAASGDLPAAIASMRKALAGDADGNYHYRIGRWYQATGKENEARAAFAETARIKAAVVAQQEKSFSGGQKLQR